MKKDELAVVSLVIRVVCPKDEAEGLVEHFSGDAAAPLAGEGAYCLWWGVAARPVKRNEYAEVRREMEWD